MNLPKFIIYNILNLAGEFEKYILIKFRKSICELIKKKFNSDEFKWSYCKRIYPAVYDRAKKYRNVKKYIDYTDYNNYLLSEDIKTVYLGLSLGATDFCALLHSPNIKAVKLGLRYIQLLGINYKYTPNTFSITTNSKLIKLVGKYLNYENYITYLRRCTASDYAFNLLKSIGKISIFHCVHNSNINRVLYISYIYRNNISMILDIWSE